VDGDLDAHDRGGREKVQARADEQPPSAEINFTGHGNDGSKVTRGLDYRVFESHRLRSTGSVVNAHDRGLMVAPADGEEPVPPWNGALNGVRRRCHGAIGRNPCPRFSEGERAGVVNGQDPGRGFGTERRGEVDQDPLRGAIAPSAENLPLERLVIACGI
jgi:hypothetical protein